MENDKLSNAEIRDIIIESGMQAIPYVGGSLATLYFGTKQEIRFKRLEAFYKDLQNQIAEHKTEIATILARIETINKEQLVNLIERLNEKVEKESQPEKIQYLKAFFVNMLLDCDSIGFDEHKYFLETISDMSILECEILSFLYNHNQPIQIRIIEKDAVDPYAIYSAINKLISYGFLETRRGSFQLNGMQDENLDNIVFLSDFGKKFISFVGLA